MGTSGALGCLLDWVHVARCTTALSLAIWRTLLGARLRAGTTWWVPWARLLRRSIGWVRDRERSLSRVQDGRTRAGWLGRRGLLHDTVVEVSSRFKGVQRQWSVLTSQRPSLDKFVQSRSIEEPHLRMIDARGELAADHCGLEDEAHGRAAFKSLRAVLNPDQSGDDDYETGLFEGLRSCCFTERLADLGPLQEATIGRVPRVSTRVQDTRFRIRPG